MSKPRNNSHASFEHMPGHLLRRCHQISVGIFHDRCRTFGLTPLQYAVLSALDRRGPLDQVTLGGIVALDRTTIAHLVNKLGGRKLVTRKPSSRDRRFKIVSITARGRNLLETVTPSVTATQQDLLAPLSDTEADQLVSLLEKIAVANNAMSRAPQSQAIRLNREEVE